VGIVSHARLQGEGHENHLVIVGPDLARRRASRGLGARRAAMSRAGRSRRRTRRGGRGWRDLGDRRRGVGARSALSMTDHRSSSHRSAMSIGHRTRRATTHGGRAPARTTGSQLPNPHDDRRI
jgi:hypothetical protein